MKVMMLNTLDGVRRGGLGRLQQHVSLANTFSTATTTPLNEAFRRLRTAASREGVPITDMDRLSRQRDELDRKIVELLVQLEALQSQNQLAGWLAQSAGLESEIDAYVAEVDAVIGYEQINRPLKLGLLTLGATAAVGGIVWAVWGYTQKKGPWRRRRKR
jgi:hypothetical protein